MIRWIRATFSDGVFKPSERLDLRQGQEVRIGVEAIDFPSEDQRRAAIGRFTKRAQTMSFRSAGRYPTRDELHERG